MMELGEGISSLSMWDIVNQSDKYNFFLWGDGK